MEVAGSAADFVFLLEDDTYLHFEFQSTYNKKDLIRFAGYDLRLYERDGRRVMTVIIYTANAGHVADGINIGSLVYSPQRVMMKEYDGDTIYRGLVDKIEAGQDIMNNDMLNLLFLPLMRNTIDSGELAVKSVQLAQQIPDTTKRNAIIAAAFALASKYLDENEMNKLAEAIEMTDLATIVIERAVSKDRADIAKKMLRRGISADAVAEDTGLDEATIRELQAELNEAV